ncbi:UNVERIFIED_CONTAM: hypothetical protein RMT77_001441 [Armadillidium vulgare]
MVVSNYFSSIVEKIKKSPNYFKSKPEENICPLCAHSSSSRCSNLRDLASNRKNEQESNFGSNSSIAASAMEYSNLPLVWDASSPFNSLPYGIEPS